MKYVKILGLLAVAATALMAFAGTASATTITSNEGTTPNIKASSTNSKLDGSFVTVECSNSTVEGNVESHGAGVPAAGEVDALTFTGCNYPVTVTARGTIYIHFATWFPITSLHAVIHIHTSVGTCTFTTASTGTTIGNLTTSSETGGKAVLDINSAKIPRTGGNFLCGSSGTWTGNYTIDSPSTLNVDS